MRRAFRAVLRWLTALLLSAVTVVALVVVALVCPYPFFPYFTERGRLQLYSDKPFDVVKAQAILARIDWRLGRSPLDRRDETQRIFVVNEDWHQRIFFNIAYGAGGANFAPLTCNVYLRHSDIAQDILFTSAGRPTEAPRDFVYFATHEIGHTLTAERLGPFALWNWRLPVWIREGTADYIGLGGKSSIDVRALYMHFRAHDPHMNPKSGFYDRYRLLTAYFLDRKGWTVDKLLNSAMSMPNAEQAMAEDKSLQK